MVANFETIQFEIWIQLLFQTRYIISKLNKYPECSDIETYEHISSFYYNYIN